MDIEVMKENGSVVAVPKGRIDGLNAGEFGEALSKAVDDTCKILIVDFSEMVYISSAGLRAILSQAKAMRAREGRLDICAPPENILEVFKISGFDQILSIHDTRAAALAAAA